MGRLSNVDLLHSKIIIWKLGLRICIICLVCLFSYVCIYLYRKKYLMIYKLCYHKNKFTKIVKINITIYSYEFILHIIPTNQTIFLNIGWWKIKAFSFAHNATSLSSVNQVVMHILLSFSLSHEQILNILFSNRKCFCMFFRQLIKNLIS